MYHGALDRFRLDQTPNIDSDFFTYSNQPIPLASTADGGDNFSSSFSFSESCLVAPPSSQQSFGSYGSIPNQGFVPAHGPSLEYNNSDFAIPITNYCLPTSDLFDTPASFAHANSLIGNDEAAQYQQVLALDSQAFLTLAGQPSKGSEKTQPRARNGRFLSNVNGIATNAPQRATEMKRKSSCSATLGQRSTEGQHPRKKPRGDVPRESESSTHICPSPVSANSIITATLTAQRSLLENLQALYASEIAFATSNVDVAYSRVVAAKNSLRKYHPGSDHNARTIIAEQETPTSGPFPNHHAAELGSQIIDVQQIQKPPAEDVGRGTKTAPANYTRRSADLDKQRQEIRNFAKGRGKCYTKRGQELATAIGAVEKAIGTLESHRDTAFTGII